MPAPWQEAAMTSRCCGAIGVACFRAFTVNVLI
jgi:hypothetical protein